MTPEGARRIEYHFHSIVRGPGGLTDFIDDPGEGGADPGRARRFAVAWNSKAHQVFRVVQDARMAPLTAARAKPPAWLARMNARRSFQATAWERVAEMAKAVRVRRRFVGREKVPGFHCRRVAPLATRVMIGL